MKAVIYARYSSDTQREESIEGQIRECTEYAKYNDMEIVGQYIDRVFSAKTDDCPDFQQMIADSAKKLFDVVLVFDGHFCSCRLHAQTLQKEGLPLPRAGNGENAGKRYRSQTPYAVGGSEGVDRGRRREDPENRALHPFGRNVPL